MLSNVILCLMGVIMLAAGVTLIVMAVQTIQDNRKARERMEYNEWIESIIQENERGAERIKDASFFTKDK